MTKQTWRKASSDLRRLLRHDIPKAGKFLRVDEAGTIYIWHTVLGNMIASLDFTDDVVLMRYRPNSYYRELIHNIALSMSPKVFAIPAGRIGRNQAAVREIEFKHTETLGERSFFNERLAQELDREQVADPF